MLQAGKTTNKENKVLSLTEFNVLENKLAQFANLKKRHLNQQSQENQQIKENQKTQEKQKEEEERIINILQILERE